MSAIRYSLSSRIAVLVFVALAFGGGCSASSAYMLPVKSPTPLAPPPNRALLVFLRPSSFGGAIRFRVIDDQGRFLGDSLPSVHFAVPMDPGTHMIYAWSENIAPLQANLAPNKTYYIVARPHMGFWKARVSLTSLTPKSEDWPKLKEWMQDSERRDVDFAAGQAYLDARKQDVVEKIAVGKKEGDSLNGEERAVRVLMPEDGI
jgi:hypothetical protein